MKPSQDSRCPGRDSKQVPPEYASEEGRYAKHLGVHMFVPSFVRTLSATALNTTLHR
jgi:hypothetical protein